MAGALPTFVIIGAQKCGTTALHSYLARHPQVSMSRPKELDFFVAERNWANGVDWYMERFDGSKRARGESSPNYTAYPRLQGVPERMAELIPDAKLIFMVRDPIRRIRANWIHTYSNRREDRPMREAVLDESRLSYLARSRYYAQLTRFLEHYPMERILILEQDELMNDRRATLRRVFGFIGVNEDFWRDNFETPKLETSTRWRRTRLGAVAAERLPMKWWRRIRNRRPFAFPFEQPEIDEQLHAELAARLKDDIERFRELTGRPFESWSV
jgi:Sulfotransferase domain